MTEREFLERIARSSDLDTVRVYADWLLEQGSSRAEFVEIQLRRAKHKSLPDDDIRARVLLHEHWRDWLGDAANILDEKSLRFEHGVLREGRLLDVDDAEALDQPQLLTVRALDCGELRAHLAAQLVPTVPALRTLRAGSEVLVELARRGVKLEALMAIERPRRTGPGTGPAWAAPAWLASLGAWTGAPNLRSIDVGDLSSSIEIEDTINALRDQPNQRGTQTLRASFPSDGLGLEAAHLPGRVGRWLYSASAIATECIDARTATTRIWLLPGGDLGFSRLELETFTPFEAAKMLDAISYSGIRHLLIRAASGEAGSPEPEGVRMLGDSLKRWRGREIEIVVPDAWILRLPA